MSRSTRALVLLAPILAGVGLFAAACGSSGPEQQILTNYFRASRVRDNVTLANLAAVSFDPRSDGSVQSFEITSVGEEERRPLQIAQLTAEVETAQKAEAEFATKKRAYQNENLEAIKRVIKADAARETLKGADAEVQAAWGKWNEEQRQFTRRVSEAKSRIDRQRALAVSSLTAPGQADADVAGMDLELATKRVTVNAEVRSPEGQTSQRNMVVTLQRAVGKRGDETKEGRWLITGIDKGAGGGAPAPTS
jgi:hypothetical protein